MEIQRKVMEEGNWDGGGWRRSRGRKNRRERKILWKDGRVMKIIISVTASFISCDPVHIYLQPSRLWKEGSKLRKALSFLLSLASVSVAYNQNPWALCSQFSEFPPHICSYERNVDILNMVHNWIYVIMNRTMVLQEAIFSKCFCYIYGGLNFKIICGVRYRLDMCMDDLVADGWVGGRREWLLLGLSIMIVVRINNTK